MLQPLFHSTSPSPSPALSLGQIAQKIAQGDTADLIAAYSRTKAVYPELGQKGIEELLNSLGMRLGIDLRPAGTWFKGYTCEGDRTDIIDPDDVSFKQFTKRLRNYCLSQCSLSQSLNLSPAPLSPSLESRLVASETKVQSLLTTISERDDLISHLIQKIESYEKVLSDLRDSVSKHQQSSGLGVIESHHSYKTLAASFPPRSRGSEGSNGYESGQQSQKVRKIPSMQDVSMRKQLWIVKPKADKEAHMICTWQVNNSLSPTFKPKHVSVPEANLIAMLNTRPQPKITRKLRTPLRFAKNGSSLEHLKSRRLGGSFEKKGFKNVGRMMFANNL